MKVLKVVWGLLFEDVRLVWILLASILLSVLAVEVVHQFVIAGLFLWLGLVGSLWLAIEHELKLKSDK